MRNPRLSITTSALVLTLFPAATAQPQPLPKQVIGLTHSATYLTRKAFEKGTCASRFCLPTGFEQRIPTYRQGDNLSNPASWTGTAAGGTAYDGRHGGVWISNGRHLALVQPETCTYLMQPIDLQASSSPIPAPDPAAWRKVVTGMCCVEGGAGNGGAAWLFVSWMSNHISKIEVAQNSTGQWTFVTRHTLFKHDVDDTRCKIGGLAADDAGRNLLVATSCFAPRPGTKTTIHVTDMNAADWGSRTGFVSFPILDPTNAGPLAPNNPWCPNLGWSDQTLLTGLAYDSCRDRLYVTDGLTVVYGQLPIDPTGTLVGVPVGSTRIYQLEGCCGLSLRSQEYTGLAMYPEKSTVGQSCVALPCNSCASLQAGTLGDAVMGNPDFGFTVSDAPDNWTAMVLGVGFGPCTTPGVGIGMCDTVKIDLTAPILLFFANSAPPGSGCSATRVVKTGTLPQQAALCGLEVSSQWVVECRSGAQIGTGVTGCHQFEISAN